MQWQATAGGSMTYRLDWPGRVLTRLGHTVRRCERAIHSWVADSDVVVGQFVANEAPSLRWQEWAAEGRTLVYDVDDDLSCVDPESVKAYAYYSDPVVQARIGANMAVATRVTAATDGIAAWAARWARDVVVVPNGLPAQLLCAPDRPARADGRVVVGWAGSMQTLPELRLVARALQRLLESTPGVVVHTVGVPADAVASTGLTHPGVQVTPWVAGTDTYLTVIDFDVWVAPYRDIAFNRAKVPTKALEAMFLGIPIVASPVGQYATVVRHGVTGLLVRADHEWGRHIRGLVLDPARRAAMGDAARSAAAAHVVEGLGPLWEKALTP